MTRDEFIADHPIEREFELRQIALVGSGVKRMVKCPFHQDKNPSMSVDTEKGLWKCFAGCGGGSVIDLIAKFENLSIGEVLKGTDTPPTTRWKPPESKNENQDAVAKVEKVYSYQDALGKEVYQVLRYVPKTFRQRRPDGKGGWVWSMDGVNRVLYRLPMVLKSQTVALAEGEKDAENLTRLGWCGTTHVSGSKNWLDAYSETLSGKDLLLFHDNDKAGEEWKNQVFDSCAGKCKTIRVVSIPKTFKDVSDYIDSFANESAARTAIEGIIESCHPFIAGVRMPIYTMDELEPLYSRQCKAAEADSLELSKWLPSFRVLRNILPGEMILIMGDTGTGKTAVLTSLVNSANPLPTLMFELELPPEVLFERNIAAKMKKWTCREIEQSYSSGDTVGADVLRANFPHVFMCFESKMTTDELETLIHRSELKIGQKPKLVILDYVQLVKGRGEGRYEKVSEVAEQLRVIAKSTRTIIVIVSQVNRQSADEEIGLHSAKDSGSLENSASLVLGIWRDGNDPTLLNLKVLKSTKGGAGLHIKCNYIGETMQISERSKLSDEDIPGARLYQSKDP